MKRENSDRIKKFLVAATAVVLFPAATANQVQAQNGDWDDVQNSITNDTTGSVSLGKDITADNATTSIVIPDKALTINGQNGANNHTISGYRDTATPGKTAPQLITNNSKAGLTIENVNLTQGGGANGGAIGNGAGAVLTVKNSNFTKNTTDIPAGAGGPIPNTGKGGAIYNENGSVTVDNSTFTANGVYTDDAGDIIYDIDGKPSTAIKGGAIYNGPGTADNPSTLVIKNGSKFDGNYSAMGGAVYNEGKATVTDSSFTGNKAVVPVSGTTDGNYGIGGAIMNVKGTLDVDNTKFTGNTAEVGGGAIYNSQGTANITNSEFTNNTSYAKDGTGALGGALSNVKGGVYNINNVKFTGNNSGQGGAIYNSSLETDAGGNIVQSEIHIKNSEFDGNYTRTVGGAIYTYGIAEIENSKFSNNGISADGTVTTPNGGAIMNGGKISADREHGELKVNNTVFQNNIAQNGGAISNTGNAQITNSTFENNGYYSKDGTTVTATAGGAVYNYNPTPELATMGSNTFNVSNTTFKGNVARSGGAIYNTTSTVNISNTNFIDNGKSYDGVVTTTDGGALYNGAKGVMNITDSYFQGNTAGRGGALFASANSTTNINAQNSDVIFGQQGARPSNVDTVFLDTGAVANLNANSGKYIQFNSAVSGQSGEGNHGIMNINPNAGSQGTVEFNANVSNTDLNLQNGTLKFSKDSYLTNTNHLMLGGGTLDMLNGSVNAINPGTLTVNANTNLKVDVDIANQKMDHILDSTNNVNYISGGININSMRSISDSKAKDITILFTDVPEISGNGAVTSNGVGVVQGPIYKYAVKQYYDNGASGNTAGEYFVFNSIGNSDTVLLAPVAAQIGGFLLMDNLYRQSFANMDMTMLLTRAQREALKFRNKYASTADVTPGLYQPSIIGEERDGLYIRPFSNFESVPLNGGPKVSNVSYGTLIGGESDIIDLGRGWDATYSFFGAYHGSHQAYNGIGIWQNGGTFGGVGTLYKGNFFTGLTANVGASAVQGNTDLGNEEFPMLMSGVAWKSGYNYELMQGKFILQPSYMMSYTYVQAFNHTGAGGLDITSDPLNVIEIIPGVKLIANLKHSWQPYLGVNMTWNLMNKTRFYANDVALDRLSVDPFVEYGVGVQKRVGDRFTGYGQVMMRNGGRNGIALTMGWRWALGD